MAALRDKVALVTGGSRGVGKGIALGLAEAGATVYITGRTVEEGAGAVRLQARSAAPPRRPTPSAARASPASNPAR